MPKPVYIVCAENITVDRETNLVSLTNIVEKLDVNLTIRRQAGQAAQLHMIRGGEAKVVAVWGKAHGDEGRKLEAQFLITPPGGQVRESDILPFEFEKGKLLHRFILRFDLFPMPQSGVLRIENLVREVGTHTWIRQQYEIAVESTVSETPVVAPEVAAPPRAEPG